MLDKIVATLSFLIFIAFLGILLSYTTEPDLWVVLIIVVYIAFTFIRSELRIGERAKTRK